VDANVTRWAIQSEKEQSVNRTRGLRGKGARLAVIQTVKTKGLYINFELHDDMFYDRLQDICIGMEINISELEDSLSYWGLRGHAAPYNEIISIILGDIRAGGYGLVIIDPT
jgi:hypothetical protein